MATGYNIILPNGSVERTKASSYEERVKICEQLIDKWKDYCEHNWLSVNYNSPFCPQNKVKMFLSSLGYFLITGSSDEDNRIVTRYKDVMNGKRQIPVSACPDYIEDELYGLVHTGGQGTEFAKSQSEAFEQYMKSIDEKVQKKYKSKPSRKHPKKFPASNRSSVVNEHNRQIVRQVVDTDGIFYFESARYVIDMVHCQQYAPKVISEEQSLYDMDSVLCVKADDGSVLFFDQNYDPIDSAFISPC